MTAPTTTDPRTAVTTLCLRLLAALRTPRSRDERGDVPGWVMIAVMTAGIVTALIAIAGPTLAQMLRDALGSVG